MKITQKWLKEVGACSDAAKYFKSKKLPLTSKALLDRLEKDNHLDWANWGIVRMLNHDGQIKYAIFAAELVLDIFEKKHPDDKRPRKAIEAAKQYLKTKSETDRQAAYAAAGAANAAAYAANAAADAAYATYAAYAATYAADAAYAAYAAAAAANAAADAANAAYAAYAADAADAADAAAAAANAAAYAARNTLKRTIIEYGITLLKTHKK